MFTGQVKRVHIATEDQARTFTTLIGENVILVPGQRITAVLVLPEIIYIYSNHSATLAQLIRNPSVKKIIPCPSATLDRYGWVERENIIVAGLLVKEAKKYHISEYVDALIKAGSEEDEEVRVSTVAQLIYQFIQ
jgi:cellobiose-specific phosphotransferase system component IIB